MTLNDRINTSIYQTVLLCEASYMQNLLKINDKKIAPGLLISAMCRSCINSTGSLLERALNAWNQQCWGPVRYCSNWT